MAIGKSPSTPTNIKSSSGLLKPWGCEYLVMSMICRIHVTKSPTMTNFLHICSVRSRKYRSYVLSTSGSRKVIVKGEKEFETALICASMTLRRVASPNGKDSNVGDITCPPNPGVMGVINPDDISSPGSADAVDWDRSFELK